jgi:hypothetical protein
VSRHLFVAHCSAGAATRQQLNVRWCAAHSRHFAIAPDVHKVLEGLPAFATAWAWGRWRVKALLTFGAGLPATKLLHSAALVDNSIGFSRYRMIVCVRMRCDGGIVHKVAQLHAPNGRAALVCIHQSCLTHASASMRMRMLVCRVHFEPQHMHAQCARTWLYLAVSVRDSTSLFILHVTNCAIYVA